MPTDYEDRLRGALLGLAVGDALGAPVEGQKEGTIKAHFKVLDRYVDAEDVVSDPERWIPPGHYTDDTQQALVLLEIALSKGRFVPAEAAGLFLDMLGRDPTARSGAWRGIGSDFRAAMKSLQEGRPWEESGTLTTGNGAAVRVGPLAGAYADRTEQELCTAVLEASFITHRDPMGPGSAAALSGLIRDVLTGRDASQKERILLSAQWARRAEEEMLSRWPDVTLEALRSHHHAMSEILEGLSERCELQEAEIFQWLLGRCSAFTSDHLTRLTVRLAPASVSLAIFLATSPSGGFAEKLTRAVNMGGDSDTVGAMVGAVAGAMHGASQIPESLLKGLANRTQLALRADWLATGKRPAGLKDLVAMETDLSKAGAEMRRSKAKRMEKKAGSRPKPKAPPPPSSEFEIPIVRLKGPPTKENKRARRDFERGKTKKLRQRREDA